MAPDEPTATEPPAPVRGLGGASIEELFRRSGALREGHFLLKSGRHTGRYLEKFFVLQYPAYGVEIGRRFADALARYDPTLVVGPTTGGVMLAFETARQLGERLGREIRGIFAEPVQASDGPSPGRALRRGWAIAGDERVVLVDDILTTGASLVETADAVRAAGVESLAAAVIVDRSTVPMDPGFPIHSLGRIEISSWEAEGCEMCRAGVPLEKPGSSALG